MIAAKDAIDLTSFGSAVDLLRTVTGGDEVLKIRIVTTGGTITVKTKGSGATSRVLTVVENEELELQVRTIVSVAGPTRIRVFW